MSVGHFFVQHSHKCFICTSWKSSQQPFDFLRRVHVFRWEKKGIMLFRDFPKSIYLISKLATQSCLTLCDSMDCSLPGSTVHGIFQAIALEWIAISFSRGSSQPRDRTRVSRTVDRRFTVWATREVHLILVTHWESVYSLHQDSLSLWNWKDLR